ncbi:hypothetical protein [Candidatus Accumulibacter vicinus]|uniref:hypothetical protein n=1 Tax=Candidatus Accumulibacter vicinus TaxID=2954382 RepID=UPI0004ACEACD|nr:hypothetical protein [Candidatus Accumulibacter vicinus]
MTPQQPRSRVDRRQHDYGRPGHLPDRRRIPDRRLPELNEVSDMTFEEFQLLLTRTGKPISNTSSRG